VITFATRFGRNASSDLKECCWFEQDFSKKLKKNLQNKKKELPLQPVSERTAVH